MPRVACTPSSPPLTHPRPHNSEKYDELVAKERDLTDFMDSFPSRRAAKIEEARNKQVCMSADF